MVQCGFCGTQFNALDSLRDEPAADRMEQPDPAGSETGPEEPHFEISNTTARQEGAAAPATGIAGEPDEIALEQVATLPARRPVLVRVLWFAGVLLLLLTVAVQWLWFNRDTLLFRYPQYVPLAQRICDRLDCRLTRDPDPGAIVLLNRDVRDHPRFDQVLLVNITIENQAELPKPFPAILLILYDTNGRIIGHRRFTPGQYLDAAVDADAAMMPRQPVHLVLEVADAGETAVSFEFYFL